MLATLQKQSVGGAPIVIQPSSIRDHARRQAEARMVSIEPFPASTNDVAMRVRWN
jgi:hypothetical protein